jgi:hypothetical protein
MQIQGQSCTGWRINSLEFEVTENKGWLVAHSAAGPAGGNLALTQRLTPTHLAVNL